MYSINHTLHTETRRMYFCKKGQFMKKHGYGKGIFYLILLYGSSPILYTLNWRSSGWQNLLCCPTWNVLCKHRFLPTLLQCCLPSLQYYIVCSTYYPYNPYCVFTCGVWESKAPTSNRTVGVELQPHHSRAGCHGSRDIITTEFTQLSATTWSLSQL